MSNKDKITKVAIVKSNKLTLTEINALTQKILEDANLRIDEHNNSIKTNPVFKRELKKIKTSTGVLAAERALVFLQGKHKKVEFKVISQAFDDQLKELKDSFKKSRLYAYNGSSDFNRVKNELILSQVKNTSMDEIANIITSRLVN